MSTYETISEHRCFGGVQGYYKHASSACQTPMRFSVYQPPQAQLGPVPVLYYLAGLTCTEETFAIKAGAQRLAAELGLMLVAPDTSPREVSIAGDTADWDFGRGAGFYVDATELPWSAHYKMYQYVSEELPALIQGAFPARADAQGIFGHSMGGHGALVIGLRNLHRYRSISAFAPIAAPSHCPWGHKAVTGYLGADQSRWAAYDASMLVREQQCRTRILIDQGAADPFLVKQLMPERFVEACRLSGQKVELRMHAAYDHGYYFIQSLMEDHLRHHAAVLGG